MAKSEFIGQHGPANNVHYSDVKPTVGGKSGDICWNTSIDSHEPAGWKCVSAGVWQDLDHVQTAKVEVSAAEIAALRATPKTLVAAPGAGKMLQFIDMVSFLDYTAPAFTETTDNMAVKYHDGSGAAASGTFEATNFIDATADTMNVLLPTMSQAAAANCVNKALVLHNTGDGEYGGSGGSKMICHIRYRVISPGL